jgi:hypothetical protein
VSVNFSGFVASAFARAHGSFRFSVPAPISPSTTPGGFARKRMPAPRE